MAKVINKGYIDTPIAGVSSLTFPRAVLNFSQDYRVKSNTGKEVILTNITSPTDRPENIRLAYNEIANIYSGTNVEPTVFAPTKKGASFLAQITNVISVLDDANADFRIDQPVSAHLVVRTPNSQYLTASVILELVGRLLSVLHDSGATDASRLEAILRGSLVPKGM